MFKSSLIGAYRNLLRHRWYASINLFGLSIRLTGFILIMLFVQHELNYDSFHEKAKRICRVVREDPQRFYLGSNQFASTPAPLSHALKTDFADVTEATQTKTIDVLLANESLADYESGLLADRHFFHVFTFPMMQGNPTTGWQESAVTKHAGDLLVYNLDCADHRDDCNQPAASFRTE
jgi:putative ABC transport system permease protein